MIGVWLYNEIPGAWMGWTLAVYAVGRGDADEYIRIYCKGGKRQGYVSPGKIQAHCGAITAKAEQEMRLGIERSE